MTTNHYWESAEFQRLNREWRRKLKAAGFNDLEQNDMLLQVGRSDYGDATRLSRHTAVGRAAYYELAARWDNLRVWPSRQHHRLWQLHAEGVGIRTATLRCRPAVRNAKSYNEIVINAERARMAEWMGSEVMAGSELDHTADSLWAEAMEAEGYSTEGYRDDEAMRPWSRSPSSRLLVHRLHHITNIFTKECP